MTPPDDEPERNPRFRWRKILVRVFLIYLVLAGMLTLLQRKLIYQPRRETQISVSTAGSLAASVEHVRVTAHDGVTLNGWRVAAQPTAGQQAEPRCHVLFFSGNAGNRKWRVRPLELLSQLGCEVWLIDYRGYAENAGWPSEEGFAKDARSVWDHLTIDHDIAPNNIVVYGQSLGGGVGVRLVSELEEAGTPPAGLITVATFSSLVDAAKHHYPYVPVNWLLIDRFPSSERIGGVSCPLLHIHGTRDGIVPLSLGRRLFEHAREQSSSGIRKSFRELTDSGHNDIFATASDEYSQAIDEFLTRAMARRDPGERPPH